MAEAMPNDKTGTSQSDKPTVIDDEDDDILVIEEENLKTDKSKQQTVKKVEIGASVNQTDLFKDINTQIRLVKQAVEETEDEIKLMKRSLNMMESSLGEAMYEKLKFLVDNPGCLVNLPVDGDGLQEMITQVAQELLTPEVLDLTRHENLAMAERLNSIENSNHAVSKMFLECHSKLRTFGQSLAEESYRVNEEIAQYEKILAKRTINVDDDDDDDVKIVEDPTATSSTQGPHAVATGGAGAQEMNMNQLRSQFATAVQCQMPSLLTTLNNQQEYAASKITGLSGSNDFGNSASADNSTSALAALMASNQSQSEKAFTWPALQPNDKVLGKKHNDVWYPGTILDVYPPNPPQEKEWRFKVRFGKGMKVLPGKHVAYKDSLKCVVRVGTRVTALYKEEDTPNTLYAGIIAEAPSIKNNKRFLVFFDDGYAQYCHASEVHKVFMQSDNVWEDIHPETRSFIKDYLDIYPERPMVRLAKGQVVKTEWNGKWWTAKVFELDASLVKMVFQADRRTEWIYRGSTRLEPLFRALTNANAIKAAGSSRGRRLNLKMKPSNVHRTPAVEYMRGASVEDDLSSSKGKHKEETGKGASGKPSPMASQPKATGENKKNVARKSTGGASNLTSKTKTPPSTDKWEAPWLKYQRKAMSSAMAASVASTTSSLPVPASNKTAGQEDKSRTGKGLSKQHTDRSQKCNPDIATVLQERLAQSSDQVEYDEQIETGKRQDITLNLSSNTHKAFVPHTCGPDCLQEGEEVLEDTQKMKGQSPLVIPLLCYWERQVCKARPNPKRHIIYRGPCGRRLRSIGEVDRYLEMTKSSLGIDLFSFDHNLHVSTEFVPIKTFCDIKDLSYGIENYPISCVNGVDRHYPDYVEYYNYRIPAKGVNLNLNPDFLSCCDCTDNCRDRSKCACQQLTIQNTSCIGPVDTEAGYHYRRLREPLFTGIFECNSRCACNKTCHNKVAQLGLRMRLQVFRTEKKGWGLRCLDDIAKGSFICIYAGQLLTDKGANEDGKQYGDEYLAELDFMEVVEGQKDGYESEAELFSDDEDYKDDDDKDSDDSDFSSATPVLHVGGRRSTRRKSSKDAEKEKETSSKKGPEKSKIDDKPVLQQATSEETAISISDDDDEEGDDADDEGSKNGTTKKSKVKKVDTAKTEQRRRAKKSTGGSRLNLSYSAVNKSSEPEEGDKSKHKKIERLPTRSYFRDDTECYIMDAKSMGNLGRYLNHSCSPNVFVQNIFVDTHDLRFPWVAFFAGEYIRAGTELTWDYNYEVGSVPDKILYCYCGSSMCRGRLL